jgi:nucleotide-binding universal stress UspA family protein
VMAEEAEHEHEHRIVVGVDGSVPSREALTWAVRQAGLTGAVIDAVIAWDFPTYYGYAAPAIDVDWEGIATKVVTDAIAEVTAASQGASVIRPKVVQGNAAEALLTASAGADLLVVGSRGHGGFVEALLGSVGQHAVHHATCPVVVIRDSVASRHR